MKKIIALICCLALFVSAVPFAVSADGESVVNYTVYTDENGTEHYIDENNVLLGEYYVDLRHAIVINDSTDEFLGIKIRDIKRVSPYSYSVCIADISKCAEAEAVFEKCEEVGFWCSYSAFTATDPEGEEEILRYFPDEFGAVGEDLTIYGCYIIVPSIPMNEFLEYDFAAHGIEIREIKDLSNDYSEVCALQLEDFTEFYQAEAIFESLDVIESFERDFVSFPDEEPERYEYKTVTDENGVMHYITEDGIYLGEYVIASGSELAPDEENKLFNVELRGFEKIETGSDKYYYKVSSKYIEDSETLEHCFKTDVAKWTEYYDGCIEEYIAYENRHKADPEDYIGLYGYGTGDVNGNGELDVFDYILVKRAYFDTYQLSFEEKGRADANRDEVIDQFDYIKIKRDFFRDLDPYSDDAAD